MIIADGITLPYSQLIDWERASIQIPEQAITSASLLSDNTTPSGLTSSGVLNAKLVALLKNPDVLLKLLPTDKNRIRAMRSDVCKINQAYIATPKARAKALLKSAAAQVNKFGTLPLGLFAAC